MSYKLRKDGVVRTGEEVDALLDKIDSLEQDFVLMKGCGDRWKDNDPTKGKECFFDFTFDELWDSLDGHVVMLNWEDRIDWLPAQRASCYKWAWGGVGIVVTFDSIASTSTTSRILLLRRGGSGQIVVEQDVTENVEVDPLFTQWQSQHQNLADTQLSIQEIEALLNF